MYVNERDQINYHGFLRALREMNHVSQEGVSKGICTVSGMNRFENGNRVAEKLMRDRLTARLGISGEKYEDYLQPKEYVRWEQRLRIVKAIEKRDFATAKEELASYAQLPSLNGVNKQFIETMHFMIASLEGVSQEMLSDSITKAVKCTVPNVDKALAGGHLLADQEINLIAEQMRLTTPKKVVCDETAWRISEYEKLISYIDNSHWEKLQKAKIYPKLVIYICELLLTKELTEDTCRYGLELCYNAIELLRDTSRLYYFIELTETRRTFAESLLDIGVNPDEKASLEAMLSENNAWEKVFKDLYAEYKVAPYMSDFCYLYYETECHNMVEVIETRRYMLDLSRVRLSEGVCTDVTIIRFEREGTNPNIEVVRRLFEKMGMCAEYRRTRFVSNDVETIDMAIVLAKCINNRELEEWEDNLSLLKEKVNLNIIQNKQQIKRYEALLQFRLENIGREELYEKMVEALNFTVPTEALQKTIKKYFTRNEITCINDLAFKYKGELSELCIDIISQQCRELESDMINVANMCAYEYMTNDLVSYLGNKGNVDDSLKISRMMLKECLAYRRGIIIPDHLYNILWLHQHKMETINIIEFLEMCSTISELLKRNSRVAFFQGKLRNYHSISSLVSPS